MWHIRPAMISDVPEIYAMLRESATDQGHPDALAVTEDDLREDGFGPHPHFRALIAEDDGAAAGLALFFLNYSTWTSRLGLYLEDLYVRPSWRSGGVARALMVELARIAVVSGCDRMHWVVLSSNRRAMRFYEKLGAEARPDVVPVYLVGDQLRAFARQNDQSAPGEDDRT